MGTNYYVKNNQCEQCKRFDDNEHIGKSSHGWQFSFQATFDIKSYKQWLSYLEGKEIINEYGDSISLKDFKELVESKLDGLNHSDECKNNPYDHSFKDDEGYSFTEVEFS